ncbi:MAG: CC_3452 family protein [Alphaproteobacteria bacterium]
MLRTVQALGLFVLAAAPAMAANYSAKPVSPASETRIATRDVLWSCGPQACTGSTQNSRPLVLCQALAKKTGRIESFTVNGRPIAAAELERCNAAAPAEEKALANAR